MEDFLEKNGPFLKWFFFPHLLAEAEYLKPALGKFLLLFLSAWHFSLSDPPGQVIGGS